MQVRMAQLIASNDRTAHGQRDTCTREQAPRPRKPTRQITRKIGISLGRQLVCPEILPARIRKCGRQFRQTYPNAYRYKSDPHDSVHDQDRSAGVDTRDHRSGDAEPGVCEGEADAEDGKDGVVAFEGRGIAHFGELEGVGIEGFEVVIGGHGGGWLDFWGDFLDRHGGLVNCDSI